MADAWEFKTWTLLPSYNGDKFEEMIWGQIFKYASEFLDGFSEFK